jgi:hypothetical protein
MRERLSNLGYPDWEGLAVVYNDFEAWTYDREGRWWEVDRAEVGHKAVVVKPEEFSAIFRRLPPLPEEAFRPHRSMSRTHIRTYHTCRRSGRIARSSAWTKRNLL